MRYKNKKIRKLLAVVLSIVVATGVFTGTFATALDNNLSQKGEQQEATTVQNNQPNSEQNSVDMPEIEVSGNTSEWTKTKTIVVTVKNAAQGVSYEYSNGGTEWESENSFVITENNDYVFYARVAGNDEKKASKSVKVEKIDNKDPSNIIVTKIPDNWTKVNEEISVKINAEDDTAVLYSMDKNTWKSDETFKFSPEEKSYTFYAKDESGNISEKTLTSKELKVDGTNPTIKEVYFTYNDIKTRNYISEKETFKLVIDSTDGEGSGCVEYSFYDSNNTENPISKSAENYFVIKYSDIPGSGKFIIKVKDLVGNESTKEFSVKKDTTAPYNLTAVSGNTNPTKEAITYTLSATDDDSGNIVYYLDGNKVGNNTITITDDEAHTVYALDLVGNKSESITVQAKNYFNGKIEVNASAGNADIWETKKTVTVTGISIKNKSNEECPINSYKMDNGEWQNSNKFELTDTKKHTFYVKDEAGNVGFDEFSSEYIDTTAPTFESAEIITENDNKIAEFLNYLSFGYFFNKTYSIEIEANDENSETKLAQSGIKEYVIEFYRGTEESEDNLVYSVSNKVGIFSFENDLLENFKGIIKITITDNAGNKSVNRLNNKNCVPGDEDSENIIEEFTIENDAPVISEPEYSHNDNDYNTGLYIDDDKIVHFGAPIKFTFNVNDFKENKINSGIGGVKFSVTGATVDQTFDYSSIQNQVNKNEYTVTAELDKDNEGRAFVKLSFNDGNETKEISIEQDDELQFKLSVVAQDNAGNLSEKVLGTYKIDTDAPKLNFKFFNEEKTNETNILRDTVEITEYGFFFKNDVEVTITASDNVSGVKSVSVYLRDCDGNYYIPSADGNSLEKLDKENTNQAKLYESDEVSFKIPADFKGQVYAKAVDKVGNDSGFLYPDGTVVESKEKHNETSNITIEPTDK